MPEWQSGQRRWKWALTWEEEPFEEYSEQNPDLSNLPRRKPLIALRLRDESHGTVHSTEAPEIQVETKKRHFFPFYFLFTQMWPSPLFQKNAFLKGLVWVMEIRSQEKILDWRQRRVGVTLKCLCLTGPDPQGYTGNTSVSRKTVKATASATKSRLTVGGGGSGGVRFSLWDLIHFNNSCEHI